MNDINQLINVIKENPHLRILPMVDTDVVQGDDFSWWIATWGKTSVEQIYHYGDRVYVKSSNEDELVDILTDPDDSDEKRDRIAAEIAWERVIAVRIHV